MTQIAERGTMKMRDAMKKLACVLLVLVLAVVCLGGCSEAPDTAAPSPTDVVSYTEDAEPAAKPDTTSNSSDTDSSIQASPEKEQAPPTSAASVTEDGTYTSPDDVALYIHTYGHLPSNFISKTKAKKAGWVSNKGNLDEVCPGMSIGGSTYYNEGWDGEELLPEAPGRTWKECDVNYHGGYRGAERLVFSNDGLIFYTNDHYKTFTQLY